jgi:hypothetical protein
LDIGHHQSQGKNTSHLGAEHTGSTWNVTSGVSKSTEAALPLGPLQNYSELAFAKVIFTGTPGAVSFAFCDRITHELLADPLVEIQHLKNLSTGRLHSRIDAWDPFQEDGTIPMVQEIGSGRLESGPGGYSWKHSEVTINVPLGRQYNPRFMSYTAGQMVHRSLIQTIAQKIRNDQFFGPTSLIPYRHYATTSKGQERIYDHPMSCDQMIHDYLEVMDHVGELDNSLECCVIGIQLWSDSTKLANFGSHKLWPMYGCFAHTPSWARHQPGNDAWFDIAYIPEVSL